MKRITAGVIIGFIAGFIAVSEGNFQCYCMHHSGIFAEIITGFIAGIVAGNIKNNIEAILAGIVVAKSGHFLGINPGINISIINGINLGNY